MKFCPVFLVAGLMVSAASADAAPSAQVCAALSSISGDRSAVQIQRQGKLVTPDFLQDLLCDDKVTVTQPGVVVSIYYPNGTLLELGKNQNDQHSVTIQSTTPVAGSRGRVWRMFAKWFVRKNDYPNTSLVSRDAIGAPIDLRLARMTEVEQVLYAGTRDLRLAWFGGAQQVRISLRHEDGTAVPVESIALSTPAPNVHQAKLRKVPLSEGRYLLTLEAENGRGGGVGVPFTVSASSAARCVPSHQVFPARVSDLLQLAHFANQDGGVHGWEVFSALDDYSLDAHLQQILEAEIIAGTDLPESPTIESSTDTEIDATLPGCLQ